MIWVDADACPKDIKEIIFRAAKRTKTETILVANSHINTPPSSFIKTVKVEKGFDSADRYIVSHMQSDDLVITADIPLAADVINNKGLALNPRGQMYTENDIRQRLGMRNFMEQVRGSGENIGGPSVLGNKEKTAFANALDRWLAKG